MTDDQIADGCRALVIAKILTGWYGPWTWTDGPRWTINPADGTCVQYTRAGITRYPAMAGGLTA